MTIYDPVWEKLLGDIILTVGHKIFPETGDQLGFVTPFKPTHSALLEFFGAHEPQVEIDPSISLLQAAEQCCREIARQGTKGNSVPKEWGLNDPYTLGWCSHFHGVWPQLRKCVTIIAAATAVGPTHGFTIYFSVRSTSFMGNLQGGQDRATSALTRSQGVLMIVSPPMPAGLIANFFILLAHACKSWMHVRDSGARPLLAYIRAGATSKRAYGTTKTASQL